jgi:hypothetical protein
MVLLDADRACAVQDALQLREAVGRGVVGDDLQRRSRAACRLLVEARDDERAAAADGQRDGEEPLERQRVEAREVEDRGRAGDHQRVQARRLRGRTQPLHAHIAHRASSSP